MNRAASRRRGKRIEAERKALNAAHVLAASQQTMWKRLTREDTTKIGYKGTDEIDAGSFYCPYIPVIRPDSFMPGDTTA